MLTTQEFWAHTDDGWQLHMKRTVRRGAATTTGRPVLIVPGYGMNGFIFGFHPRGTSLESCLALADIEVWTVNLRLQGASRPLHRNAGHPSLRHYAELDVAAAVQVVLKYTQTAADKVDLFGCSLGGSIAYAHMALVGHQHIGSVVTVGAPLRWANVHPAVRFAFSSPRLAGAFKMGGARTLARAALPLLARRAPRLLSVYMNSTHVDLDRVSELIQTVEDPHPRVNKDIALWIGGGDMVLRGVNITSALSHISNPLLVVVSNRDGIVPEPAALSALDAWGGRDRQILRVGDDARWYAHADLFVGNDAPADVFEPVANWLRERW